jgi:hypothetical protein
MHMVIVLHMKYFRDEGTTVEGTTVEGTTVEGTTVEGTTVEGTTVEGTTVEGTTVEGTMGEGTRTGTSVYCTLFSISGLTPDSDRLRSPSEDMFFL